jgi:nicotinate-nucleotide adenylyltransferase
MMKPPPFGRGQRIGLFGGSFNPAHYGHYMVALYAMKRLQLDWVWWLVSPQNPLKDPNETAAYNKRFLATRRLAKHPRFVVTDLERQAHSHNTAETLHALSGQLKQASFIWIMGADSFANLHKWHHWNDIVTALPLAFLARPGYSIRALSSPAAIRYATSRIPTDRAASLVGHRPPAWVFLPMPLRPESSTAIRNLNQRPRSSKHRAEKPIKDQSSEKAN